MFGLNHYTQLLLQGDQRACYSLINSYLTANEDNLRDSDQIKTLYRDVFQPSMQQIGHLWASNQITVAQEHVATAITQHLMASLYSRLFEAQVDSIQRKVLITCPSSERHELPSRMLADLLVLEGADVIFVGANVPTDAIIQMLQVEKPQALIISCTIQRHLPEVKHLIATMRHTDMEQPLVLVGGYAFDQEPSLATQIGADYYCATFEESIHVIRHQEAPCHQVG